MVRHRQDRGIKLVQAYRRQHGCDVISAMPSNHYGLGDNFDLNSRHIMAALVRKTHEAKLHNANHLTVWGTGTPRREFLYVEDCADASVFLMKHYSGAEHVNVGSGEDVSIGELIELVMKAVGFDGRLEHDLSKADGTPHKLMSVDKLRRLGCTSWVPLHDDIIRTVDCYLRHVA